MFWDLAGGDRLNKYGNFAQIDAVAKQYSYTHEQVFWLSWHEVMNIISFNRESMYVELTAQEIKRKDNEAKAKTNRRR
jgi:hypothetical protein